MRVRNWARLGQKTEAILKQRGVTGNVDDLSPSIALPLLSAAVDETRDELQDLWARLLANAMDPARANRVRQRFIAAVKQMDPLDAVVLQKLSDAKPEMMPNARDFLAKELNVRPEEIEVSVENLYRIGCFEHANVQVSIRSQPTAPLTSFARELMRACAI